LKPASALIPAHFYSQKESLFFHFSASSFDH
jgi:hypothetical protein